MTLVAAPDIKRGSAATTTYLLPLGLRNFVRNFETGLVSVAIVIGLLSGLLVAAISHLSEITHSLLFDIPWDARLSATGVISWQRTLLIPTLGGLILSIIAVIAAAASRASNWPTPSRPMHSMVDAFPFAAAS